MDLPELAPGFHAQALRGLGRIHRVTGTVGQAVTPLMQLQARLGRALRVLDLACGRGDVARAVEARLRREQPESIVDGVDLSATAVALANEAAQRPGAFRRLDLLQDPLPEGYDAVLCTVFLHHLDEDNVYRVLRGCAKFSAGCMVDLRPGRWARIVTRVGVRLLSRSPVVHYDGPASVRSAIEPAALQEIARAALAEAHPDVRVQTLSPTRQRLVWGIDG